MIINIDREPKYSLYYIGGIILELLNKNHKISIENLYKNVKVMIDENLHIDFLYYSLDWLYILSLIKVNENKVMLC
ncbi:ABC-three component system middle component 6 [Clostridium estertheticum]|uniref:ABC-three component system middle component 6 n=1 Tax=Clostridium estertheticum TaxID=238834 RepID=UPI001C7E1881|nr:ABC-three component system middle component 6 [Clostridium estertheticum]MBX4265895.1 hypothetical protein [Clostridium estertheticum]WLC90178.1 hypothetical protein KTC95_08345 [Clostridium estertheticum]